mmetsp:Transcript_21282/g.50322  ORF Transcript_21282/g.50322 Transcript_21282/m.50322 type:complete len:531 (+) Transcript_21282:295-1887(+)
MDSSEDAQNCPICLESIYQDPSSDSNNDATGSSGGGKNRYHIGAAVPCGHLFHYECFSMWQASRVYGSVKCPTCNVQTQNCVRLYLDVAALGGAHCGLGGEDDISLSSIEDDAIGNDDEDGAETTRPLDNDGDKPDESVAQRATKAANASFVDLTESAPVSPLGEGSHSVTDECQVRRGQHTAQREQSRSASCRSRKRPAPTTTNHPEPEDDEQIKKLTRLAKKFKRQCLQKNAQYKEQYAEKRKISDRVRCVENELKTIKAQREHLEREREATTLQLNESRLIYYRIQRERDNLESHYKSAKQETSKMEEQLRDCRSRYEKELERVRVKSMSEVQQILDDHPKVVEENRFLKQRLQKLNRGRAPSSNNGFSRSASKDRNKALREMDQKINSLPQTMPSSSSSSSPTTTTTKTATATATIQRRDSGPTRRKLTNQNSLAVKQNNSTVNINRGQYSSQASRMMKATSTSSSANQKGTRPAQSAVVRDLLSATPSQNNASKKRLSRTSLSISQNKRMKSFSASRRDIFQRKS